ncbi:MAG: SAM-dependent methyltransferase, partial [Trebonia sp.]
NKLRFVAGRLGLAGGERLLDAGCGWGSLTLFMAREYGVRATGISPAPRQREYIAARAAELGLRDLVTTVTGHFELTGPEEVPPRAFDAVSMLGSIVHMPDLAAAFGRARAALRRGGMLYVSESCFRNAALYHAYNHRPGLEFVRRAVFGFGELRPLSDLVAGAEDAGFSVVAVDDLTAHYARTIEDWLAGVRANRDLIESRVPGYAATLERYLETANAGWGYTTKHYALTCKNSRKG